MVQNDTFAPPLVNLDLQIVHVSWPSWQDHQIMQETDQRKQEKNTNKVGGGERGPKHNKKWH